MKVCQYVGEKGKEYIAVWVVLGRGESGAGRGRGYVGKFRCGQRGEQEASETLKNMFGVKERAKEQGKNFKCGKYRERWRLCESCKGGGTGRGRRCVEGEEGGKEEEVLGVDIAEG